MSGERFYYGKYEKDSVGSGEGIIIDLLMVFVFWAMTQLAIDLFWETT